MTGGFKERIQYYPEFYVAPIMKMDSFGKEKKKKRHKLIEILNKSHNSLAVFKIVTLSAFMAIPAFMTSKKMSVAANDMPVNKAAEKKTFRTVQYCRGVVLLNIHFLPRIDSLAPSLPLLQFILHTGT